MRLRSACIVLLILAIGAMMPPACATSEREVSVTDSGTALGALARESRRQESRPDRRSIEAPAPSLLSRELREPLKADALERAERRLDEVLAEYRAAPLDLPDVDEAGPADDEARLESLQSYVQGRAERLRGNLDLAEASLRLAARLDPGSPRIWSEYAEVELLQGNRPRATSSFRRALALDPSLPRALDHLALDAMDRGDHETALQLLARLVELPTGSVDPALPRLVDARLGRALFGTGHLSAAVEVLTRAMDLPEVFGQPTNYSAELGRLYRERGRIWIEIGDASLRLGDTEGAALAYANAERYSVTIEDGLLTRRVFLLMRSGRPAEAAQLLLDQIRQREGRIDSEVTALLRHVVEQSSIGDTVSLALSELAESLGSDPALRRSLTRAAAAVAPNEQAMYILRSYLADAPSDRTTLRELFDRAASIDDAALLEQASLLTEQRPVSSDLVADALIASGRRPATLLEAEAPASDASGLVRAHLLEMAGRFEEAQALAARIGSRDSGALGASASVLATRLAFELGSIDNPREHGDGILRRTGAEPGAQLGAALSVAELDLVEEALEIYEQLLAAGGVESVTEAELLVKAGFAAGRSGAPREAESMFFRAIELQPTFDQAYDGLLALYNDRFGRIPSSENFSLTVRRLNESNPESVLVRWLRAQEMVAMRQADLAREQLEDIVVRYPTNYAILATLIQVWQTTGALGEGQEHMEAEWERLPGVSAIPRALASVKARRRELYDAVQVLEQQIEREPGDADVSRMLEGLLRSRSEASRADELASLRRSRSLRTPDLVFELARDAVDRGDWADGAALTREMFSMERPAPLSAENWAVGQLARAQELAEEGSLQVELAIEFQRAVADSQTELSIEILAIGLALLSMTDASVGQVIAEFAKVAAIDPESGAELALGTVETMVGRLNQRRPPFSVERVRGVAEGLAFAVERPLPAHLLRWFILTAGPVEAAIRGGRAPDYAPMQRFAGFLSEGDLIDEFLIVLVESLNRRNGAAIADTLVTVATHLDQAGAEESVIRRCYREALIHDPNDVQANNNLGYRLIVQNGDLEEAERLIERAYRSAEQSIQRDWQRDFVTDSLGWVRYKLGIIHDEFDAEGKLVRRGAVSVLLEAMDRAERHALNEPSDAQQITLVIVADHLADSLWAAGERERAIRIWDQANAIAAEALSVRDLTDEDLAAMGSNEREAVRTVNGLRQKLEAARSDREPRISPISRPVNERREREPAPAP